MILRRRHSLWLAVNLLIAIALDTAVQLFWKIAVLQIPETPSVFDTVAAMVQEPAFIVVGALLICQAFNWLNVLERADLSFAQPMTALGNVTVCVLSAFLLNERVDALQIVGIAFVVAGVWFVSQTDAATMRRDSAS